MLGKVKVEVSWKDRVSIQTVHVVTTLRHVLLGLPSVEDVGVVKLTHSVSIDKQDYGALYPQLPCGLGTMAGIIELNSDVAPHAVNAARRISIPLKGCKTRN